MSGTEILPARASPRRSTEGRRHAALGALVCFWVIAMPLAVSTALSSDWPPYGEAPTLAQVQAARTAAWSAAAVAVVPLACGLLLAGGWRLQAWAIAFGVGLLLAVLGSEMLIWLTGSPVRA